MRARFVSLFALVVAGGCTATLGLDDKVFDDTGSGGAGATGVATSTTSSSGGATTTTATTTATTTSGGGAVPVTVSSGIGGSSTSSSKGTGGTGGIEVIDAGDCNCLPSIAGWTGPLTVDASCQPPSMPVMGLDQIVVYPAPDAQCADCFCPGPGGTCANATIATYTDVNCNAVGPSVDANQGCTPFPSQTKSVMLKLPCAPIGGAMTISPDAMVMSEHLCLAGPNPSCSGGRCVPAGAPVCFYQAAETPELVDCPSPGDEKFLVASTLVDSRTCSPCSCGSCVFASPELTKSCSDPTGGVDVSGEDCLALPIGGFTAATLTVTSNTMSCTPSGGAPLGTVAASANGMHGVVCCSAPK